MSVTPNRHLPLMEPSQSEPEAVYNAAMEILDTGGPGGSIEVETSGASPGVRDVSKIKFIGASVTEETGGVAVVTIDPVTGGGGGGGGGSPTFSGVSVKATADQTITTAAVVAFDAENYDTDIYHSNSVNNSRLTAPKTGYYAVIANFRPNMSTNPLVYCELWINGSAVITPTVTASSTTDGAGITMAWEGHLTAGDFVELHLAPSGASTFILDHTQTVFSMSLRGFSGAKVSGASVVAALPASPTQGDRAFVTDATATTFLSTVAGGGSSKVPVVYDGTNWLIG